jgi:hypothetical protein
MTVPERCVVSLDEFPDIVAVVAYGQRLVVTEPFCFGGNDDGRMLTLLATASAHLVDVDWELSSPPPWPVRTLVHLPPPRSGIGYADQWRASYRFGLCTYRRGPGFVQIRDVRPDGEHLRVRIDGEWAEAFETLTTGMSTSAKCDRLLTDLTDTGLAVRLTDGHHMLPTRLRRWPIPFSSV